MMAIQVLLNQPVVLKLQKEALYRVRMPVAAFSF
jgi:hypothetical protein